MDNSKKDMREELAALAKEMDLSIDPASLGEVAKLITALPAPADPGDAREVVLEQTGATEFSGSLRRLGNIFEVDLKRTIEILDASDKVYTTFLIGAAVALSPFILLLGAIKAIYDGMVLEIKSKENAKILYALYKLENDRFKESELAASYEAVFQQPMDSRDWEYAREMFLEFEILSLTRNNHYKREEKITVKRRL